MKEKTITIIGGGPVGTLQACYMAEKGFKVELYEMRDDIRKAEKVFGRSINLALSHRGEEALREIGLEKEVTQNGIPMYGRMIHNLDGSTHSIPYGKTYQNILSIDRRKMNEFLITAAEKYSKVHINFCHKLLSCDFESKKLVFERTDTQMTTVVDFDVLMGCDGAFSNVRHQIMKSSKLKYSQEFIEDAYMELRIPAGSDGEFQMRKNFLHIWPRHTFMMIGLPDVQDHKFVMTLFMPFKIFEELDCESKVLDFFRTNFSDALKLMGESFVVNAFKTLAPLPMVSIKCEPYHLGDYCVLFGDAAHAMIPFYGQGLNCGLEDLLVFKSFMDKYDNDFGRAMSEYSKHRTVDAQTMNDLASYNHVEMKKDVNTISFYIRKKVDTFLYWLFPKTWIPLYTMISFSRMRYHECLAKRTWQNKVLKRAVVLAKMSIFGLFAAIIYTQGLHKVVISYYKEMLNQ